MLDKKPGEQLRKAITDYLEKSGEEVSSFRLRVANAIHDFAKTSSAINPNLLSEWINSEDSFISPIDIEHNREDFTIRHRISKSICVITKIYKDTVHMSLVIDQTTKYVRVTPHDDGGARVEAMPPVMTGFYKLMSDEINNEEAEVNSLNAYSNLAPCPQDKTPMEEQGARAIPNCSEDLSMTASNAIHHMDRFQELYERFQRGVKEPTDMTLAEFNETYRDLVHLHNEMNPERLLKALIS